MLPMILKGLVVLAYLAFLFAALGRLGWAMMNKAAEWDEALPPPLGFLAGVLMLFALLVLMVPAIGVEVVLLKWALV